MSLYADYRFEREGKSTIENDRAFAVYSFGKETCYIDDLYVKPEHRRCGEATRIATWIADLAKQRGCAKLMVTVTPSFCGSHEALETALAFGMVLHSSQYDLVHLVKEI
jgi:GNAT superfamily N-acetyltransferase